MGRHIPFIHINVPPTKRVRMHMHVLVCVWGGVILCMATTAGQTHAGRCRTVYNEACVLIGVKWCELSAKRIRVLC